jgi:nitrite reductase/ring-hydroxylating ferredoxin subunit
VDPGQVEGVAAEGAGPAASRSEWVAAGAVGNMPPGSATVVAGVEPPVAVFNVAGTFYATDDTCTHAKSSLATEGYLDDDIIECGYHFAHFCARDGRALTPPAREPLRTYEVRVTDDQVYLRLPT